MKFKSKPSDNRGGSSDSGSSNNGQQSEDSQQQRGTNGTTTSSSPPTTTTTTTTTYSSCSSSSPAPSAATVPSPAAAGSASGHMCAICGRRFSRADVLRKHARAHSQCACVDCGKTLPDREEFLKHQMEVHSGGERVFNCSQCSKTFKELRTLRLHLKIHNSEYPEQCKVCAKVFRTKWQLKQHQMDHGGERPYPCPECSFTCKTKQQLNEHRRKHSGEKAYSCPQCGTRFTYRNGLIKHTKLNRCPKKIVTPEGETIIKKRTRNTSNSNAKSAMANSASFPTKSAVDQKLLEVLQRRSAERSPTTVTTTTTTTAQDLKQPQVMLLTESITSAQAPAPPVSPPSPPQQLPPPPPPPPPPLLVQPQSLLSPAATSALTAATGLSAAEVRAWAASLPAGATVRVTTRRVADGGGQFETLLLARSASGQLDVLEEPLVESPVVPSPPLTQPQMLPPPPALMRCGDSLDSQVEHNDGSCNGGDGEPVTNFSTSSMSSVTPLPSYSETFAAVDPNEILRMRQRQQQQQQQQQQQHYGSDDLFENCYNLHLTDNSVGEETSCSSSTCSSSSPSSDLSSKTPPAALTSSSYFDPSPSNRSLLERVPLPPVGLQHHHLNEEAALAVHAGGTSSHQGQVNAGHQEEEIMGLDDNDFTTIKSIVEQTFRDGRDMLDLISTV